MNSDRCSVCGEPYRNIIRVCERCRYTEPAERTHVSAQRDVAEEMRRIDLWERVQHPMLLAATWFAAAGAIPSIIFLFIAVINSHGEFSVLPSLVFVLATAAIAGGYGALFGAGILDPYDVRTGRRAFGQGCIISSCSFVTFIFLLSVAGSLQANSFNFVVAFLLFMVFGSIFAGWAVLLIGGIAGWLLFKRYRT